MFTLDLKSNLYVDTTEEESGMAKYHVRADGSMGVCHAKEGNCPFGGEAGTKHFTNKTDAIAYSEKVAAQAAKGKGSLKSGGLGGGKPPVPPKTASAAAGDDWPRYEGDFSKWNGVPATNHWRDVPEINNDPSNPSTKVRAYVMDKMVDAGFGDGAKGNDLTYDGVGYLGDAGEVATAYVGDDLVDPYFVPDDSAGVGYDMPVNEDYVDRLQESAYDNADYSDLKVFRPRAFGSITNPDDTSGQYILSFGERFNKSYHGMSLSDDGKTLEVEGGNECFAAGDPEDLYEGDDKEVLESNKNIRTFFETMDAHGVTRKTHGDAGYTIDATDPKAIDNYFEAYRDFKSKIGEDVWKKGIYGLS